MTAQKAIKAWGGFRPSDGELHCWVDGWAVYRTRKAAKVEFDDVRPVWIVFEEPKGDEER